MGVLTFLEDIRLRLLFFGGKGGVGKTTCATAAALHWARRYPQRSFLPVSTDPAHSLTDSLGEAPLPANVTVLEFNAQAALESFKARYRGKLVEIAASGTFLDDEDVRQILDLSLPGLDELMAWLELSHWVQARSHDLIVVDTAPTGHALRLLHTPEMLRAWLRALDALLAKRRFLQQRFRHLPQPDDLDRFLQDFAASVQRMEEVLSNSQECRFVPVMIPEELVISETLNLLAELRRLQIAASEIVVNRMYPMNSCPLCTAGRRQQQQSLEKIRRTGKLDAYILWGLPLLPEEVRGLALETLWDKVMPLEAAQPEPPLTARELPPRVEAAPPCPSPDLTFLIFAGKGGVGKTTLACATAIRLAQEYPKKEILLSSVDPAHSLAACLKAHLGSRPKRLGPNLTALEIDAPREFAAFKQQYQQEIEHFLEAAYDHLDFPFDRQVMKRLIELSPPGLDEIMALMRVMDFMEQGRYDIVVLDAAPTGHLLRLLELPELIDQWLKTLFGLLLKYNLVFRFPSLSQRLVKISRSLKRLRQMWQDPTRAALYAVTILTEMAFQETCDLLSVCERLAVPVPLLFLNMATPALDCPLCAALNRREGLIREKFQQTFAGRQLTVVYRQSEPRGLERLAELGQTLYRPRITENRHGAVTDLPALSE